MSTKKAYSSGDEVIVNRSGQRGLVIRSEKLSLPWGDRYVIVDEADHSNILDDCCGYGYKTKAQAAEVWKKSGDYVKPSPNSPRSEARKLREERRAEHKQWQAAQWIKNHHKLSKEVKDLIDFSAKSRIEVKAEDVQELLMQNDYVADLDFAAKVLEAVLAQRVGSRRADSRPA